MGSRILSLIAALAILLGISTFISPTSTAFAQGGSPLIANDTGTPGTNNWEINFGVTAEHAKDEKIYALPFLNANYGLGERIQLKYELGWILLKEENGETKRGLGNSIAGFKWRFYESSPGRLALSTYPQVAFNNPTTSVELGIADQGLSLLLPIEVDLRFGALGFSFESGYLVREFDADAGILGAATGYRLTDNFQLLGELFSVFTDAQDGQRVLFNLGSRLRLTPWFLVINSFGTSIRRSRSSEPKFIGYLALQFRT